MAFIRRDEKSFNSGLWRPLTGYTGTGYIDWYGSQREPSKLELVQAYEDIIYSCVQLISNRLAAVDLRLYVQTNNGDKLPKCRTKALSNHEKKTLSKSPVRSMVLRKSADYTEVIEHPLLDLLHHPCHGVSYYDLIRLTSAYAEVTGNSYWLLKKNGLGVPVEAVVLPSHCVTPLPDLNDVTRIRGYQYVYGYGVNDKVVYQPDEIVHFKFVDLLNPYINGLPPVRAIWQRQLLAQKEMSMLGAALSNSARMDGILTPEEGMGWAEAERLSKEVTQRFRGAGTGGWFVTPEKMQATPLNWMPKDMSSLQLYDALKKAICAAFSIPPSVFDSGSNRAEKESDIYYLAEFSLVPRLIGIAQRLNQQLVPYYDERLWLEFDNPVPQDKAYVLQERTADLAETTALLQNGVVTREEARLKYGYSPAEWAKEPLVLANMIPAEQLTADEEPEIDLSTIQIPEDKPEEKDYSQQIIALQTAYYAGQLPRAVCVANARILFGMGDQAEALFPELPPDPPKDTVAAPGQEESPNAAESTPAEASQEQGPKGNDASEGQGSPVLAVPDIRQETDHDCGAACVRAVMGFFGEAEDEAHYIEALGTTHENGTTAEAIQEYLKSKNLNVDAREGRSVEELGQLTGNGRPVICAIKAGDTGHWVIACGVQADKITLQDPLKGRTELTAEEFQACWKGPPDCYGIAVGKPGNKCLCCEDWPIKKALTSRERKIAKVLKKYFKVQRQQILDRIAGHKAQGKAGVWDIKVDLSNWTGTMTEELLPLVVMSGEEGVLKTVERLGNPEGLTPTVQPKLKEALQQATLNFCEDTNRTTSLQLEAAKEKLRETINEGLTEGEKRNELRRRVQEVFDHADNDRSDRIAITESSRAQHTGQYLCAEESGLVKGFKWLLSSMPCPVCEKIAADNPEVELGKAFHVDETRPAEYGTIKTPPAHPGCQCSIAEVLKED